MIVSTMFLVSHPKSVRPESCFVVPTNGKDCENLPRITGVRNRRTYRGKALWDLEPVFVSSQLYFLSAMNSAPIAPSAAGEDGA